MRCSNFFSLQPLDNLENYGLISSARRRTTDLNLSNGKIELESSHTEYSIKEKQLRTFNLIPICDFVKSISQFSVKFEIKKLASPCKDCLGFAN